MRMGAYVECNFLSIFFFSLLRHSSLGLQIMKREQWLMTNAFKPKRYEF